MIFSHVALGPILVATPFSLLPSTPFLTLTPRLAATPLVHYFGAQVVRASEQSRVHLSTAACSQLNPVLLCDLFILGLFIPLSLYLVRPWAHGGTRAPLSLQSSPAVGEEPPILLARLMAFQECRIHPR